MQPVSNRVYLLMEGEFYFGGEEGQDEASVSAEKDDVLIPKGAVYDYEGRMRLFLARFPAYEQDSGVHYDDL